MGTLALGTSAFDTLVSAGRVVAGGSGARNCGVGDSGTGGHVAGDLPESSSQKRSSANAKNDHRAQNVDNHVGHYAGDQQSLKADHLLTTSGFPRKSCSYMTSQVASLVTYLSPATYLSL